MKVSLRFAIAVAVLTLLVSAGIAATPAPPTTPLPRSHTGPPPPPPARKIPGLNAEDPHPRGCVDCHVDMKEFNMDVRISTLLAKWSAGVEPKLLAATKAAADDPAKITGKHPAAAGSLKSIPGGCLSCHSKNSKTAPPFARLMHKIHLTGGDANLYMGYYQGDCTHCHKIDQKTGAWSVPSAPEP